MICRGDIYYAKLDPVKGFEQGGVRFVLVIQNNKGNKHGSTVIAAPITAKWKKYLSAHSCEAAEKNGPAASMALLEQKEAEPEGKKLCLCPNCANQFYSSPDHVIHRAEGKQAENSICEYCEFEPGLDFIVINRRKRLGDC